MKNMFFRLTKADETRREVSGVMVSEAPDKMDEIFDYETSKPYFKAWSDEISKATEGKSLGNVREMHQPVAVGKVTALDFDDAGKKIEITAKVYQDSTWEKVSLGILTGFSIGGSYAKKWEDGSLTRYTAKPAEVSLVDNPAVPDAHFTLVRADGHEELVKAVGSAPSQMWNCGKVTGDHAHATKAAAIKCMKDAGGEDLEEAAGAGDTAVPDSDESLPSPEKPDAGGDAPGKVKQKAETAEALKKCLWCIADAVSATATASSLAMRLEYEESDLAASAKQIAGGMHELIVQMAEEVQSKFEGDGAGADMALAAVSAAMEKAVEKIKEKAMSKTPEKPADTPTPSPVEKKDDKATTEVVVKVEGAEKLSKAAEEFGGAVEKAVKPLTDKLELMEKNLNATVEILGKVVEKVASLPAPAKGVLRVVKGKDATEDGAGADEKTKKATSPEEERHDLMKQAFLVPARRF